MFSSSRTTRLYLQLEKGRCELDLGRWDDALDAFDEVIRGQARDDDYPRIAALRGRAAALLALGRSGLAVRELERCRAVAEGEPGPSTTGQIAALAAGDLCLAEGDPALAGLRPRAAAIWRKHWGGAPEPASVRDALGRMVY